MIEIMLQIAEISIKIVPFLFNIYLKMIDIFADTLIDSVKLVPFLFVAYLIMEYIEHKLSKTSEEKIKKSGKIGPAIRKFTWNIPTMWLFGCSNKFLCSKNNNPWNTNSSVSFNIR